LLQEISQDKNRGVEPPKKLLALLETLRVSAPAVSRDGRQGGETWEDALEIEDFPYTDTGTTSGYTDETGVYDNSEAWCWEGTLFTNTGLGPDVWYHFQLETAAEVTFSICNSDYDTALGIFLDSGTGPEALVAGNDDYCGLQSEVTCTLPEGSYYVAVDGYSTHSGNYELVVTTDEPCELSCPPDAVLEEEPPCGEGYVDVTNGGCNSDPPVFGEITLGTTICGETGTWVFAGEQQRDTDWYAFTLAEPQALTLEFTAEYPLEGFIVSYSDCDNYTVINQGVAQPCLPYTMSTPCLQAGEYALVFAPQNFAGVPCGSVYMATLDGVVCEPGEGDFCNDPIIISEIPFTTTGNTDDNRNSFGNSAPDEWYAFSAGPDTLEYTISLCGSEFDTYLWLLQDDCTTEIAHNDDSCGLQSEIVLPLPPGEYRICVEGFSSQSGAFQLEVTAREWVDPCVAYNQALVQIEEFPFTLNGSNLGAPDVVGESGGEMGYAFSVSDTAVYAFETCLEGTDYDTDMYLFSAEGPCDGGTQLLYNDGDPGCEYAAYASGFATMLVPGDYQLVVSGYWGAEGNFVLEGSSYQCEELDCQGSVESEDNGGCNSTPPVFDELTCGETICGETWAEADSRDTDWFVLDFAEISTVELDLEVFGFDPQLLLIRDPGGECQDYNYYLVDENGYCQGEQLTLVVEPGTYYAWVGHHTYEAGVHGEYALTFNCTPFTPETGEFCSEPNHVDTLPV